MVPSRYGMSRAGLLLARLGYDDPANRRDLRFRVPDQGDSAVDVIEGEGDA